MAEQLSSNKSIAKNTLLTYVRMLFNLVVSLYTSRVILHVLGVTELGTYNVVGGIVSIFTFIGGSLAGASSRFLAYELPRGNKERLAQTFSASLIANIIASVIFFLVAEIIGVWLILKVLVIPPGREFAAMYVYQVSVLAACLTILQTPYEAAIIAHEKINVFAYIGILDTVLKLIVCYITVISPWDRLISYAVLILLASFIIRTIYWMYCRHKFEETKFQRLKDKSILKPMLVFSGWDMFNGVCLGAKQQGQNIILNFFFTVTINAACGFANSIYAAIRGFANNFMISVRPVITKSYSLHNFKRMEELIIDSSKFSFSLILLLSLPFLVEGDFIITLWLKTPPDWTVVFCQMQLLMCIISVIFSPVYYGIMATGNNKIYNIQDGLLMVLSLPISYTFFKLGFSPITPFIVMLVIEIIKDNAYVLILKYYVSEFSIWSFYKTSILPCLFLAVVCFLLSEVPHFLIKTEGWVRFICSIILSLVVVGVMSYTFLLPKEYKYKIKLAFLKLAK